MALLSLQSNRCIFSFDMFTLNSYAKVNLSLQIVGIRDDGYHILSSIMSYVDLFDLIHIKRNNLNNPTLFVLGRFGKHFNNNDLDALHTNIIIKTLEYLSSKYSIPTGFDIVLEKNIPIASGMGGGSSNAAAMIRFCNEYFGLGLSISEMMIDAVKIGADVPFFINDRISLCEGIGEIVTPFNVQDYPIYILILNPMVEISTIEAYRGLDDKNGSSGVLEHIDNVSVLSKIRQSKTLSIEELLHFAKLVGNDLIRSSSEIAPVIPDIVNNLESMDRTLLSQMSGSGSTCFALYDSYDAAKESLHNMRRLYPFAFGGVFKFLTKINHRAIDHSSLYDRWKNQKMVM